MMSAEDGLRVFGGRQLPLEDAGHDFDAGERILHLVRDRGSHFPQRRQAIAQPLALLRAVRRG